MSARAGALEAVDRILNRGGEPDEVLRAVVSVLHERVFVWVALAPDGPEAGTPPAEPPLRASVLWRGRRVGELRAAPREPGDADENELLLDRVALLVSAHAAAARSA